MKALLTDKYIFYYCEGCRSVHGVPIIHQNTSPREWTFSGDANNPTLSPSIKTWYSKEGQEVVTCHHFVRNGEIDYCSDSPHVLKGQKVPLKDLSEVRNTVNGETIEEYIKRMYFSSPEHIK